MNEKIVFDPTKEREAKTPLDSTAIKEKIDNGELKIKGKEKKHKVPLPKEVHKALEEKAKAEGKTPDQKAAEIVEEKAKAPEKTEFKGKVNKYGFMHFEKDLLAALGWAKGEDIPVKITRTEKGIAVERA